MKRVIVAMQNTLVSEVVAYALKNREMLVEKSVSDVPNGVKDLCEAFFANVLIMDVTRFGGGALDNRINTVTAVKAFNPAIKVCIVCDNVSDKELSHKVVNVKKAGQIDAFFYQSVPSDYIADVISAM